MGGYAWTSILGDERCCQIEKGALENELYILAMDIACMWPIWPFWKSISMAFSGVRTALAGSSRSIWMEVRGVCEGVLAAEAVLFFLEETPEILKKVMVDMCVCCSGSCGGRVGLSW